jgi:hypothetical protein
MQEAGDSRGVTNMASNANSFNLRNTSYWWKQSSFAGGELSPDLYGRDDQARYQIGARLLYNMYPHPFGGASNRPGTKFIHEAKTSSKAVRLVSFRFSQTQAYILEFGDKYIRVYKDQGIIINDSDVIVEITTVYAADELFDLHFTQSADTLYITHRSYPPTMLTRSSHTVWTWSLFTPERGPFMDENVTSTTITPSATNGAITLTASSGIFTSAMVGSLVRVSHTVYGQAVHATPTSGTDTYSDPIQCNGNWSFMLTDAFVGTLQLQISEDNGSTWQVLKVYAPNSDSGAAITDSGSIDHFCYLRIHAVDTSGSGAYSLNASSFIQDGFVTITAYTSGTQVTGTVYTDASGYFFGLSSTAATTMWALGAWSAEYGYPRCSCFYQNRLIFASTNKDPLTIWASQTGDYTGFYTHATVKDDDAITAPLVSSTVNVIENLIAVNNLIAFTAGGAWKIGAGSSKAALTPTSISAVQQGFYRASKIPPIAIGDSILYCSALGNAVYDFAYDVYTDVYKGSDMTLFSKQLFRNHTIVDWALQDSPDNLIWAVRDDGVLLSFTYIKDQQLWAWAEHETDGKVESVAVVPGDLQDYVYLVVNRTINGSTVRYIECMQERLLTDDMRYQWYVDCGLALNNPKTITGATRANPCVITCPAHGLNTNAFLTISDVEGMTELNNIRVFKARAVTTDTITLESTDGAAIDATGFTAYTSGGIVGKMVSTVSGLEHLEGKSVAVLADGAYVGLKTVTSGAITLDDKAAVVIAGLPYEAKLQTMDIYVPKQDGTSMGREKRLAKIIAYVKDSYVGYAGANDFDNMEPLEPQLSAYWGIAGGLRTGYVKFEPSCDRDIALSITVWQPQPFPLTILSLEGRVESDI